LFKILSLHPNGRLLVATEFEDPRDLKTICSLQAGHRKTVF